MEIKLLLKEKDRRILVDNFRTGTLLAQGGAPRGQSAYEQAVEGGYTGTKEEFEEALAVNIEAIGSIADDIETVSDNISDVVTTAENISDIHAVADNETNINTVATDISNVNTVAGISSDVTQVAGISSAVQTVSSHDSEVTLVADNMASVMATANSITDVQNVASDITNINTVAGIASDVSTVATNSTAVNTAATNIAAIIAAPSAATNAANSAAEAQIWAEGTDGQVSPLGGTHSSKVWAQLAQQYVESIGSVLHYKGSVATYADLPTTGQVLGDMYNVLSDGSNYAWDGTGWDALSGIVDLSAYRTAAAQDLIDATYTAHVSNTSNPHSVTKAQVGLGSVDNTADLDKPISTATQTALNAKQDTLVSGTNIKTVNGNSLLGSGNIDALPSQTGQSGKFLTTDGTDASWANVDALPSQTGQSGKFLTTDGSAASWGNIPATVSADGTTIEDNSHVLTTIAVKDQKTTNADKFWTGTKAEYDAIVTKDADTFYHITDDEPSPIIYAKTGFSNIDSTAKNIGNWSTNVTNCITEIPQNIKLELSNGTLTIKAGSKFYIPNGFESDGTTRKFDEYILPSDIVTNPTGSNRKAEYFLNDPKTGVERFGVGICFSGANAPSGFGTYAIWYDTANNIIKKTTDSGSTWSAGGISLPFGTFSETSAILVSIDQVFNGFGYMGNTIFAVPGVKGLIPNGRNADGSLKNNTFELSSVLLATRNISATSRPLCVNGNELLNYVNANYDDKLNFNIDNDGTNIEKAIIGSWSADSNGKITSIKTSKCFHALDYYDTERVSHLSSPDYDNYIQLSLGATGTEYIAPADGMFRLVMLLAPATYCFVNKTDWPGTVPNSNAIAGLYYPQTNTGAGGDFVFTWRVKTGEKFKIAYTGSLVAGSFMFIYNVGDSSTGN